MDQKPGQVIRILQIRKVKELMPICTKAIPEAI